MSAEAKTMPVSIMGREFRVACNDEERPQLTAAVEYLNGKMQDVKDRSKATGLDRIAIMAALNIAHEYLSTRVGGSDSDVAELKRRMTDMENKIDQAMEDQDKLF
jgi:cell division protein ZapA